MVTATATETAKAVAAVEQRDNSIANGANANGQ